MANIKSAKKRILVNQTKADQNKAFKSELKTEMKKYENLLETGSKAEAAEGFKVIEKVLDQACAKGLINKSYTGRKTSQYQRRLNAKEA